MVVLMVVMMIFGGMPMTHGGHRSEGDHRQMEQKHNHDEDGAQQIYNHDEVQDPRLLELLGQPLDHDGRVDVVAQHGLARIQVAGKQLVHRLGQHLPAEGRIGYIAVQDGSPKLTCKMNVFPRVLFKEGRIRFIFSTSPSFPQ